MTDESNFRVADLAVGMDVFLACFPAGRWGHADRPGGYRLRQGVVTDLTLDRAEHPETGDEYRIVRFTLGPTSSPVGQNAIEEPGVYEAIADGMFCWLGGTEPTTVARKNADAARAEFRDEAEAAYRDSASAVDLAGVEIELVLNMYNLEAPSVMLRLPDEIVHSDALADDERVGPVFLHGSLDVAEAFALGILSAVNDARSGNLD